MFNDNSRVDYYDGLRGVAVLTVWLSHTSGRGQFMVPKLEFHGIGHVGVMLFFVLSGYLLASSIAQNKNQSFTQYFIKRFFRIAPIYYFVISIVFFIQLMFGVYYQKYLHISGGYSGFLRHLLFIKGDSVFWTISAEFVFYMALPFIFYILIKNFKITSFLLLFFSFIYFLYSVLLIYNKISLPELVFVDINHSSQYLDVFIVGAVLSLARREKYLTDFYKKYSKALDVFICLLFIATILATLICVSNKFLFFEREYYLMRYFSIFYALIFGSVLFSMDMGNKILVRLFSMKPLACIGMIGYSWYLLHMPVIQIVNELDFNKYVAFYLSTLIIFIISNSAFILIEKKFMYIGKKIALKV